MLSNLIEIDISGEGDELLRKSFSALEYSEDKISVLGYRFSTTGNLVFCWAADSPAIPFPLRLNVHQAADLAISWLRQSDYPPQPIHDGDNHKGWNLTTNCDIAWSVVMVSPKWIMYGK